MLRVILTGVVMIAAPAWAQTIEESFRHAAQNLNFVSYGEFVFHRAPRDYSENREVTTAWRELQSVMQMKASFEELAKLAEDADPKVRTLAMLKLFAMEEPRVFRIIHAHLKDNAETFLAEQGALGRAPEDHRIYTAHQSVGQVAASLLNRVKYPWWEATAGDAARFDAWSAKHVDNPDWIGWYDFLYERASQGTLPIQPEAAVAIDALRKRMEGTSPAVRAWMWLGLTDHGNDFMLATQA